MRFVPLTSIALTCALGTAAARADDVTFTGFAHGSETVAFSLVAPNAVASGTVNAGGFATILNGSPSFVSYCVDLYQHISFGTLYPEYTAPGTTHVFANNRAYADLGRLYANAGVVDTSVEEAAIQIARIRPYILQIQRRTCPQFSLHVEAPLVLPSIRKMARRRDHVGRPAGPDNAKGLLQ